MESAPKRRRTSPRTSVPIEQQPCDDASGRNNNRSTTPGQFPPANDRNQLSFASPTKTSLARRTPSIFPSRQQDPQQTPGIPIYNAAASSQGSENLSQDSTTGLFKTRPRRSLPDRRKSSVGLVDDGNDSHRTNRPGNSEGEIASPNVQQPASGLSPTQSQHVSRPTKSSQSLAPAAQPPSKQAMQGIPPKAPSDVDVAVALEDELLVLNSAPNQARNIHASPIERGKIRTRDKLLAELASLKNDLEFVERANEENKGKKSPTTYDGDELLQLLGRHLLPSKNTSETLLPSAQLLDAALNPIAWLPFGNQALLQAQQQQQQQQAKEESLPPLISHHPVELRSKEELPFLQMFSPFTITDHAITITSLPTTHALDADPNTPEQQPLVQRQSITLSSSPRGMFEARVELTVNTATLEITELEFPRLEPTAAPELRPLLDNLCQGLGSRSTARNVCIATWAMAEWCRVAAERAAFWTQIEREFSSKEGVVDMAAKMRARKPRRRNDDDDETEGDSHQDNNRGQLLTYMGLNAMEVSIPATTATANSRKGQGQTASEAVVRLSWNIKFDWTGDAHSEVSVLLGVPGKWLDIDERGSLANIPKIWKGLIDRGEKPIGAARTIVALLVGDVD